MRLWKWFWYIHFRFSITNSSIVMRHRICNLCPLLPFWQIWGGWDLAQRFYWTHSSFILDLMTSLQMNTPNKLHQKLNLPVDKLWKKYILCSNMRYQDNLVGILLLTDRLCEKSIYWDYNTSVYLFFSGLWQYWKTKSKKKIFSSFSFLDCIIAMHCLI